MNEPRLDSRMVSIRGRRMPPSLVTPVFPPLESDFNETSHAFMNNFYRWLEETTSSP